MTRQGGTAAHDFAVAKLAASLAVGIAFTLPLAARAGTRTHYVPDVEVARIVAYFGHTYLPGWLPRGYVFSRWEPQLGSNDAFGEYLVISFGNHGRRLTLDGRQPARSSDL